MNIIFSPPNIPQEVQLSKKIINELVKNILNEFGLTKELEIEIIFLNQEEIRELNKTYRQVDRPTDVLSFPQEQFNVLKTSLTSILGSIIICPDIVIERKESFEQIIKHGMLHLLGYDHEQDLKMWDQAAKRINCTF